VVAADKKANHKIKIFFNDLSPIREQKHLQPAALSTKTDNIQSKKDGLNYEPILFFIKLLLLPASGIHDSHGCNVDDITHLVTGLQDMYWSANPQ